MKKRLVTACAIVLALALMGCGGQAGREITADWPGGAGSPGGEPGEGSHTPPQQTPPYPADATPADAEHQVYRMFEITDPTFSDMVAYRTLLPAGWAAEGSVEWACNSANAPAQIFFEARSEDGEATLSGTTEQWYAMQYTYGSPVVCWGFPQRAPVSPEQAALEHLAQLGVADVQFMSSMNADADGNEWSVLAPGMEQLRQELATMRQELQDPYLTHIIYEGTATSGGQPCDVRAEAAVFGYRSHSQLVKIDYCAVLNVNVMLAPRGRMAEYLSDMLDIQANSIINQNWLAGREQVSAEIWALLREKQDAEWAWARRMSAQLSARVDAIIAHTNSWIASTDAMMDHSSALWEDYIFDQNNYYAGDGSTISVPSSWDHVWLGNDGSVYASNSSDLFDNPNTNPNMTTYYTELEPVR